MASAILVSGAKARPRPELVSAWLFTIAALVVAMILVGGLTRLTDSGLSITEWKPISGALPPLGEAGWADVFAKYRTTAEYQYQNHGMTLDEFKGIYWWEWAHRLLGRAIGMLFLLPLVAFWWLGMIPKGFKGRLVVLFFLGGLQGLVGWWMVASGLAGSDRVDVSQFRLAAHLSVALVLLGALWWTALDVRSGKTAAFPVESGGLPGGGGRVSRAAWIALGLFALVCVQILLGAFVAGLDGGKSYTDWPLIDGKLVPEAYGGLAPFWRNAFENRVAAQIDHRFAGYLVFVAALAAPFALGQSVSPGLRRAAWAAAAVAVAQVVLGIVTLVHAAPLGLSAAHQLGGVALFLTALTFLRAAILGGAPAGAAAPAAPERAAAVR